MATVYEYENSAGRAVSIYSPAVEGPGIRVISRGSCSIPDDEIPNLISALQNYMSRRAKEISKGDWRETADQYRGAGLKRHGLDADA